MSNTPKTVDEILTNFKASSLLASNAQMMHDAYNCASQQLYQLMMDASPGTWVTDDPVWRGYVEGVNDYQQNLNKLFGVSDE